MKVGMKVRYEDELFTVIYRYESGYCEIKDMDRQFRVVFAHENDLDVL